MFGGAWHHATKALRHFSIFSLLDFKSTINVVRESNKKV
jgi:hypothetical protein